MKVVVTGASGLIGTALVPHLERSGHAVLRLTRSQPAAGRAEARWGPESGRIDAEALRGVEGAVHLAGENIAARRWTQAVRRRVRDSRLQGTRLLAETLAGLSPRPRVLVSASAVGYYGDRGEETLTERSSRGTGFLADLAEAWEAAAAPARAAGLRVVHTRFGIVLDAAGGALARLLPIARLGLGGPLGHGRQYWSWIALDDVVEAIGFALERDDLAGPVNVVSAQPLRQREFAAVLGRALHRPASLPAPAWALRLALGQMADEVLLASARVLPERLLRAGFTHRYPILEAALARVLGEPGSDSRSCGS